MDTDRRVWAYGLAAGAGALAGLRSVSALAAVGTALERGGWPNGDDQWVALAARFAPALRAAAVAEMAADKLPNMPDRTAPPILAGRVLLAALAGALVARAARRSVPPAVALAALAAVSATFAGLRLRLFLNDTLGVPNLLSGLAEDGVVVAGAGAFVAQSPALPEPTPLELDA